MSEYSRRVEIMECDFNRHLPPSNILGQCLSMTQIDIYRDGCGRENIISALGAVWMISSMRIFQYDNLRPGDEVIYRTFPRVIGKNCYHYYVEALRGGETVLRFDTCYIPVHFEKRKLVPIEQMEPLWNTPPGQAQSEAPQYLKPDCEFTFCGSDTVRLSDCDSNGHMTSSAYCSFACNALDFFNGDRERLMKMMQVDFHSEVLPGTRLELRRGEADGLKYVQGVKPDGKVAFTAACDFAP